MTKKENSMENIISAAERKGKELEALDRKNERRMAKGRPPLPDPQERADMEVQKIRPRVGGAVTVKGEDAIKLFEMRKAAMKYEGHDPEDDEEEDNGKEPVTVFGEIREEPAKPGNRANPTPPPMPPATDREAEEIDRAVREAASVRRVQDLKNGRVDHDGNWSPDGQKLEGGDETSLPSSKKVWGLEEDICKEQPASCLNEAQQPSKGRKRSGAAKSLMPVAAGLNEFKEDLYERLRVSFEAIENTLSDLQGRVAEIVTASTPKEAPSQYGSDEFAALIEKRTPVTFDVGGTKMTFDAVTVFHAPPCITVVSKFGSATITPKPGAQMRLTYEMNGQKYADDPVTYLGTRFELPMFGLSFVGFIRDRESDMMDVDPQGGEVSQES